MPSSDGLPMDYLRGNASLKDLAMGLRQWGEDNPWKSAGIGLIPGVGQAYAGAQTYAMTQDPEATTGEYVMDAAGYLPWGRLGKAALDKLRGKKPSLGLETVNEAIGGPETIERLKTRSHGVHAKPEDIDARTYQIPSTQLEKASGPTQPRIVLPDPDWDYDKLSRFASANRLGAGSKFLPDFLKKSEKNKKIRLLFPEIDDTMLELDPYMDYKNGVFQPGIKGLLPNYMTVSSVGADRLDPQHHLGSVLGHEYQHAIQSAVENYPRKARLGTSPAAEGHDFWKYLANPGESEARLNEYMFYGTGIPGKGGYHRAANPKGDGKKAEMMSRAIREYTKQAHPLGHTPATEMKYIADYIRAQEAVK